MKQGEDCKSRKMRKGGVRKDSIHFHMGFSKTQGSEASSCSLCFWRSVVAGFCFLLYPTHVEAAFFLEKKAKATLFSSKKIQSLSVLKYHCCQRVDVFLENEYSLSHLLKIGDKLGRKLIVQDYRWIQSCSSSCNTCIYSLNSQEWQDLNCPFVVLVTY